ncbi:hypothetical protein EGW08_021312 [Elysia chlorotica]|uniref:Miro domain-containing protein n=1 Tax=Elysia chlorotica TaxID=188477 RepID=A0A433SNY5_ELYCH|nr:hypothetical protein EGW08_021312 [Elysia chlorotica]
MALLQQTCTPTLRCVVVGDDAVGKTSMLLSYATSRYPTAHVPSVFDNYAGSVKVCGRRRQMQMLDTVEMTENPKMRQSLYYDADVFVVCFSVISPESLQHVEEVWLPEIRAHAPHTPCILVGLQADLRTDPAILSQLSSSGQSPVTSVQGEAEARRFGAACYLETSPQVERDTRKLINSAIGSVLRPLDDPPLCTVL